jgi:sigma-54 dependent transcriptional regulator, acetoin dehydrogenase operon transcriptional activator AcoR
MTKLHDQASSGNLMNPGNPSALPMQPFFSTPEQRLALARQRYFEEGVRPSGLVSETVIQSWSRCVQARRHPNEAVAFATVTASRAHTAMTRSRVLLEAADKELTQLASTLSGTSCSLFLTDPQGVVVHHAHADFNADERVLPLARRVGCNLSEESIGTNALGLTARTGEACTVMGAEHFFGGVQVLHCAAAPIRDIHGQTAGVLDLTSESRPFGFDAAAVVGLYATAIENHLLRAQSAEHIVIQLQTSPAFLGTPMEGLAGIAPDGRIAWMNRAASRLLGLTPGSAPVNAEATLALTSSQLAALTRSHQPTRHRLLSGLQVWMLLRMQARDGAAAPVFQMATPQPDAKATALSEPLKPIAETLRNGELHLIEAAIAACDGNVSKAARSLGVSRGLIYRHLKPGKAAASH